MAGNLNIELASTVTSPEPKFSIRTQNRDFNTQSFGSEEAQLFEDQFNALVNDFDSRLLSELFLQRREIIGHAAAHAKQVFDERRFGGINAADNEIAFDVIRPGHVRADPANGNSQNDWYFDPGAAGWNDWIGDGTSANDYSVNEDQVVVVLGFMDQDASTEVSALNVDRFGRNVDMLPKDLNDARITDNENDILVQALPAMVATDMDRIHMRLRHDRQKESQPRLLGINFGVGSFMNSEDF